MMSPLDAHVLRHCGRLARDAECGLIPTFFASGESIESIMRRMTAAGYRHHVLDSEEWHINGQTLIFTDYFEGRSGSMNLACGHDLGIAMRFDAVGRLEAAMGDNSTACL
jgi:hypothetical protein